MDLSGWVGTFLAETQRQVSLRQGFSELVGVTVDQEAPWCGAGWWQAEPLLGDRTPDLLPYLSHE